MGETIRSFIAVELPESLHRELGRLIEELKASGADVKWVRPENIHITLKFLGNIDQGQAKQITAIIDNIVKSAPSFLLKARSIGAFPKPAFPRVVWAGVDDPDKNLKKLAAEIDEALLSLGFEKENREFSAHLTIGRVRTPKNKEKLQHLLENTPFSSDIDIKVDKVVLFKSTLTPGGSIYTKIHESKF